eukprot:4590664-Prymnesium_polylepis.2
MTGMSPMSSALYSRPSAALKRSAHGRVLTSAARFGVSEPEQPESTCARKSTDERACCKTAEMDIDEVRGLTTSLRTTVVAIRQPLTRQGCQGPRWQLAERAEMMRKAARAPLTDRNWPDKVGCVRRSRQVSQNEPRAAR